MGLLRLAVCVSGIYTTFLLWAIAQERLSSPFLPSSPTYHPHAEAGAGDKFPSSIFLNYVQAIASCLASTLYLVYGHWRNGTLGQQSLTTLIGLSAEKPIHANSNNGQANGKTLKQANGQNVPVQPEKGTLEKKKKASLTMLLLQVAAFQTTAGPVGFMALRHISYPTMVLGKSCKLIPVMMLNVLLYRRRFSSHKYLVVVLVTLGISLFMFFGKSSKKGGSDSAFGLTLLLVNLLLDGLTNSTQDQIFSNYPSFSGQQMMFAMSSLTLLGMLPLLVLPLPSDPWSLISSYPHHSSSLISYSTPAALESLRFLLSHQSAIQPLLAYACLGGIGQLFIFETIQHFGSLTLVMVTVTRKLFTMLLSVIVFNHQLTKGQWGGIAVVFLGVGLEAQFKRRDVLRKARRDTS